MRPSVFVCAPFLFAVAFVPACAATEAPSAPRAPTSANANANAGHALRSERLDAAAVHANVKKAVALVDAKEVDEAIALLEETRRNGVPDLEVSYELAYAYKAKGDLQKAIALLEAVVASNDSNPQFVQFLGNCYDDAGNAKKALETYTAGLERFPKAGRLYFESGIVEANAGNTSRAASLFVRGTEVDPMYKTNYYALTRTFSTTEERLRTTLYGEVFLNLGGDDPRDNEVRNTVWDAYANAFEFGKDGLSVTLTKTTAIPVASLKEPFDLPFAMTYELAMSMGMAEALGGSASANEPAAAPPRGRKKHKGPKVAVAAASSAPTALRFDDLHAARKAAAIRWATVNATGPKASPLLAMHRAMITAGVFDAYDRWLFNRPGATFEAYCASNGEACGAFKRWARENPLRADGERAILPFDAAAR